MTSSQKIRVRTGMASAVRAGAVMLLNQTGQGQAVQEATVPQRPAHEFHAVVAAGIQPIQGSEKTVIKTLRIPLEAVWNNAAQRRFQSLAVKDALDEISAEEKLEMESLNRLRRRHEAALNPEESLREYKQRKLTRDLMQILEKYVEFHRPSDLSTCS